MPEGNGGLAEKGFGSRLDYLQVQQELEGATHKLAKARDRDRLLNLIAPVDGVVQQLAVNAPGAVVTVGAPVLMVVPDDEGIAVEAALSNKDAGFVLPGQKVEVKVEALPFTRYGTVPGSVTLVSSDASRRATAAAMPPPARWPTAVARSTRCASAWRGPSSTPMAATWRSPPAWRSPPKSRPAAGG